MDSGMNSNQQLTDTVLAPSITTDPCRRNTRDMSLHDPDPEPSVLLESLLDMGPENKLTLRPKISQLLPHIIQGQSNRLTLKAQGFIIYTGDSRSYGRGWDTHLPAASQVHNFNTGLHPAGFLT